MKTMKSMVSSKIFLSNFMKLKKQMSGSLPTDVIIFQCDNCKSNLPLNIDGVIQLEADLEKELSTLIDEMSKSLIEAHCKESEKCVSSNINIHQEFGTPQNIILSFSETNICYVKEFTIAGDSYKVDITVSPMASDNKAIFVLYNKATGGERMYSKFIECNFGTFLNIDWDEKTQELEVWQLPMVKSVANMMISQQEQEIMLMSNMKDMEHFIIKNILDEKMLPGNQQEEYDLLVSNMKEMDKCIMKSTPDD